MEQERTIEQRIKDVDAQLAPFDKERAKVAQWGGFMPVEQEEHDLLQRRENLFNERNRSKAS